MLPSWLLTPAQPEASPESLLRPSDPADGDAYPVRTAESLIQRARALQHGTLVHRLLQSLPDVAAGRRREAALAYLARNADGWAAEERQALAESTLALIADARFAPVFVDQHDAADTRRRDGCGNAVDPAVQDLAGAGEHHPR